MLDSGLPLTLVAECTNFQFSGEVLYAPKNAFSAWVAAKGNIYYHGYWMHEGWLNAYRDILLNELSFPEISDCGNLELQRQIKNSVSVGIHVRRGDFVQEGRALPARYYHDSILHIESRGGRPVYFIFSDDILWCKRNRHSLGFDLVKDRVVFVAKNKKEKAYIDMQLLSMCKTLILCQSSFSFLAYLLNENADKYVVHHKEIVQEQPRQSGRPT